MVLQSYEAIRLHEEEISEQRLGVKPVPLHLPPSGEERVVVYLGTTNWICSSRQETLDGWFLPRALTAAPVGDLSIAGLIKHWQARQSDLIKPPSAPPPGRKPLDVGPRRRPTVHSLHDSRPDLNTPRHPGWYGDPIADLVRGRLNVHVGRGHDDTVNIHEQQHFRHRIIHSLAFHYTPATPNQPFENSYWLSGLLRGPSRGLLVEAVIMDCLHNLSSCLGSAVVVRRKGNRSATHLDVARTGARAASPHTSSRRAGAGK
jgi:hypothetical protein